MKDLRRTTHDPEFSLGAAAETAVLSNACIVCIHSYSAGGARLELGDAGYPPASSNLACESFLITEDGESPDVVDDDHVARIVLRGAIQVAGVVGVGNDVAVVGAVIHAFGQGIACLLY